MTDKEKLEAIYKLLCLNQPEPLEYEHIDGASSGQTDDAYYLGYDDGQNQGRYDLSLQILAILM